MGIVKDTIIGRYLSPNGSNYNIRRGYLNEITEIFADYEVGNDTKRKETIENYKKFIKNNLTFEKIVDMLSYYIFEDINYYVNGNGGEDFIFLDEKEYKMIKETLRKFDERLCNKKNCFDLDEIGETPTIEDNAGKTKKRGRKKKNN